MIHVFCGFLSTRQNTPHGCVRPRAVATWWKHAWMECITQCPQLYKVQCPTSLQTGLQSRRGYVSAFRFLYSCVCVCVFKAPRTRHPGPLALDALV